MACGSAQVKTVRFLMDGGQPWAARFRHLGDLYAREDPRDTFVMTALLAAAGSYCYLQHGDEARRDSGPGRTVRTESAPGY